MKLATSMIPYFDRRPRDSEESGFCASGILLLSNTPNQSAKVLMLNERRSSVTRYNFIGGKRECRNGWFGRTRLETSFETAVTEFQEETGMQPPSRKFKGVFWFPDSKYLLFIVKGVLDTTHLPSAVWLTVDELTRIHAHRFHDYIRPQIAMVAAEIEQLPSGH